MCIEDLFARVFTSDYEVKPVGRDACRDLIMVLSELEPGTDFGDIQTGFMQLTNVIAYGKKHKIFG